MVSAPPTTKPKRYVKRIARVVNPRVLKLAGSRRMPMQARVEHRGRRSGRTYATPLNAQLTDTGFLIPMPYGAQVDWCRNIMAAGECVIRLRGVEYAASDPEIVSTESAQATIRASFRLFERFFIRVVGIDQFLHLRTVRKI